MPAPRVRERRRPRSRRATYDAYLSSRAWSEKRKQWYAAWLTVAGVEPSCLVCGGRWTLKSGHLHHITYARPGAEACEDLLPLCRRDHQAAPRRHRRRRGVATHGPSYGDRRCDRFLASPVGHLRERTSPTDRVNA